MRPILGQAATGWLGRYPFSSPFVRRWVKVLAWPTWFTILAGGYFLFLITSPGSFGFDVRIYQLAAQALVTGGDPWAPSIDSGTGAPPVHFAGPPSSLLPFIVTADVPTGVLSVGTAAVLLVAAIWALRRLDLPLYWLLFPPVFQSIWVGNMNILVIALLLAGSSVGSAAATILKVYALAPLLILGRWRHAASAMVLLIATLPVLPWESFLAGALDIGSTLMTQSWTAHGGALTSPVAKVGGAVALCLMGRERAAWLVIPVLFPAAQIHYLALALPVFARDRGLAFAGVVPVPGVLTVAVIVRVIWERQSWLERRGHDREPTNEPEVPRSPRDNR